MLTTIIVGPPRPNNFIQAVTGHPMLACGGA
jgi:hypothetical protein